MQRPADPATPEANAATGWDIAIDIGGTFVDFVARPPAGEGHWRIGKRLRHSSDTADAISAALIDFLRAEKIEPRDVAHLRHGTTIATNALLELREPPVVLITTQGFADVLTLGRQNRRDLRQSFPKPPVPPHLCPGHLRFELPGRVDAQGRVATPLDVAALDAMLDRIGAIHGPDHAPPAIAVCLLFAPLNPVHERAVASALRARWPDIHLSLSHQADPRLREFERMLSTVLDAYIRPAVSGYVGRLGETLASHGLPHPWIMRSVGGLAPSSICASAPLTLAMSGPAAAANAVGEAASRHAGTATAAIGIDVGGTSTDICLVAGGAVLTSNTITLNELDIRVATADIASIAVGGGSILRMTGGLLRVGPHSAGSVPGPACYDRGGSAPTLTDAALLAGLLPGRLGASFTLDRENARHAMASGLGIGETEAAAAAWGAIKVAEAMIAEAVRRKAFSRGIDPREAVLIAAGGGGALHAAEVADRIGCKTVIVPRNAGVLAAGGLMQASFCEKTERPIEMPLTQDAVDTLARFAAEDAIRLQHTVSAWWQYAKAARVQHEIDISYQGQGHSLPVPYDPAANDTAALAARFDALHERVRGHAFETRRRILALRSIATCPAGASVAAASVSAMPASAPSRERIDPAPNQHPLHRIIATEPPASCPVFARTSLTAGTQLNGPALIDATDTTIWVPPGWTCDVAPDETLLLKAIEAAR